MHAQSSMPDDISWHIVLELFLFDLLHIIMQTIFEKQGSRRVWKWEGKDLK